MGRTGSCDRKGTLSHSFNLRYGHGTTSMRGGGGTRSDQTQSDPIFGLDMSKERV